MKQNYTQITINALLISFIGVFGVDYFSHLLFSNPMETLPYFFTKSTLYFVFSILFLLFVNLSQREFIKVSVAGITVALLWGAYYNILPSLLDYYPFGISLNGITFLGMGLFGTGFAFGVIHTLAFIGGYYGGNFILKIFGSR